VLVSIKRRLKTKQDGFTMTELTAVIVILGILMIPLSALTLDFFGSVFSQSEEARLATESQTLLRSVVEELRIASSVRDNNALTDANEPPSGWSTSNAALILIISTPAINSSKEFIIDPLTSEPYQNELIYFVDGTKLYKRTLANPNATGNAVKTSCPAASASESCPADRVLTEHFKSMDFTLYDQDDIATTTIPLARSLVVNVSMEKAVFGPDIQFNNSMRMTMRNTL
jgi:prepilin-type N-terminal cleavage/methylation domain-containing protein